MKKLSNFIYFCITFLFLTFINIYFSALIVHKLSNGWGISNKFFRIIYAENTGAAFSIMQNSTNILIVISVIAIFAIFYYVIRHLYSATKKEFLFLSFLTAGILGNLYERVFFGCVRDFFEFMFINFPIFNISDIFINIGVLGIIILILLAKKPIKLL